MCLPEICLKGIILNEEKLFNFLQSVLNAVFWLFSACAKTCKTSKTSGYDQNFNIQKIK